ncbi:MAG: GAF domain-containing protein [Actinobacteria bacterium]|nr:GAF domain-containing protein [Actinomycetota bacterium]
MATGVLASEDAHRALLQATVEVARAIFRAKASSVLLYDEVTDELVFEAVAGEGSETLVGERLPSSTGIGGWVLVTRQPIVLDDVSKDARFAEDAAKKTGYLPKGLMCVPLIHEEEPLGVLYVLDRPQEIRFSLEEMELLGLFGNQAAIALDLLRKARRARAVLDDAGTDAALLARVAENLEGLDGERRAAGVDLLRSLEALFS